MHSYSAQILIIGINPYVDVQEDVLQGIFEQSGKSRGPIPVRGMLQGHAFTQTLVRYQGAWRLYLNTPMRQAAGIDVGDTAHVELEFNPEPRITPIPPQFEQALSANPKIKAVYDNLTPGHQKEILRYLGNLKNPESLTRNSQRVISHLQGQGQGQGQGQDPDALHALMRRGTVAQARVRQAKSPEQPNTARKR